MVTIKMMTLADQK